MIHNIVAFQGETRLLGEEATNFQQKDPQSSLIYTSRALGKSFNDTVLANRFLEEFIPLEMYEDSTRFSIEFKVRDKNYTVEESASMVLEFIRKLADKTSGDSARDCVITVPVFWTSTQRRSLIISAEAARLNVLSLMNENTGAALYYGIDRFDNETDHKILMYNLGSSYTQVSVVKYVVAIKKASKLSSKPVQSIEILSHAWEDAFGGRTLDAELARYLNNEFVKQGGKDVMGNTKAEAKLIHAANQAKKTLSASKTALVSVPGLISGFDFMMTLEREVFEEIVEKHSDKIISPIKMALEAANLTIDDIDFIEILGGPARIPKVQEIIAKNFKQPHTHLNGDESMAQGAAIFAANFSSEVVVKPLWLIDRPSFPIKAVFTSPNNPEFVKEKILFDSTSSLSQNKKVAFTIVDDIEVIISYQYNNNWIPLNHYYVSENSERFGQLPQVIFTFSLDSNGFVKLDGADSKFEIEKEDTKSLENPEGDKTKKTKIIRQELNLKATDLSVPFPPRKDLAREIKERLDNYAEAEEQRKQIASNRNELESYIYFLQEKMEGSEFLRVISPDDLVSLQSQINKIMQWLESGEFIKESSYSLLKEKISLEKLATKYLERETELMAREDAILDGYLRLQELYREMAYLNKTKTWIPTVDKEKVLLLINETISWIDQKTEEQKRIPEWEEPVLKINILQTKINGCEKRVEIIKKTGRPKQEYKMETELVNESDKGQKLGDVLNEIHEQQLKGVEFDIRPVETGRKKNKDL